MKRRFGIVSLAGLAAALLVGSATAADEEGFQSLFDGKTLEGWDGNPKWWSVQDGAITGTTDANEPLAYNEFCIWRGGEVDDFVLRFKYRLIGGNSGVQYRSFEAGKPWSIGGYQGDFASNEQFTGILYGEQYRGILALRGQKVVIGPDHKSKVVEQFGDAAELQKFIKMDDWNDYEVIFKGFTVTHVINGHKMIEATDEDVEMRRRGGLLAFQIHRVPKGEAMKVQVKDIRLKRLPMEGAKKIVLIAGPKSHGFGGHEHNAGCLLLAKLINENVPGVFATVYQNGWPKDPSAFDNADSVVIFCDGGGGHVAMPHLAEMDALAKKGIGIACLHYGVEIPKGEPGNSMLGWIGGYYETFWSVNPHWTAEFKQFPKHPVAGGLKPFTIEDEWYYHMRFQPDMKGVTPILTAIPPDSTRERPDDAHAGNPTVRAEKGNAEHVAWTYERSDGGRGFGFTGGHWHWNWACDSFRKAVINGILWTAKMEVPAGGFDTPRPTMDELLKNQDYQPDKKFNRQEWEKKIQEWNAG
ncbi:MAG: family 16 glycoside hydrolase [Thermoguttaceae bacterium]